MLSRVPSRRWRPQHYLRWRFNVRTLLVLLMLGVHAGTWWRSSVTQRECRQWQQRASEAEFRLAVCIQYKDHLLDELYDRQWLFAMCVGCSELGIEIDVGQRFLSIYAIVPEWLDDVIVTGDGRTI